MSLVLTQPRKKKAIGLTPLIDVVFILLLFFMLTTTFNRWEFIDLQSSFGQSQSSSDEVINKIVLREDGAMALLNHVDFIEDIAFVSRVESLPASLDKRLTTVVIPYQEVKLQQLITLIEQLNQAGFANVTLVKSIEEI